MIVDVELSVEFDADAETVFLTSSQTIPVSFYFWLDLTVLKQEVFKLANEIVRLSLDH